MSLVAYNSSDESDHSDIEDVSSKGTKSTNGPELPVSGHISDEDDYPQTSTTNRQPVVLEHTGNLSNSSVTNQFKALPAPKDEKEAEVGEDDLEEEVKPKQRQIQDAPKPPPKRTKQPVKITIPSLQSTQDSDDDEAAAKPKPRPSEKKSGLFSMLPAPMHVAKKEQNRILIPHTLTKRPPQKKAVKPAVKPKTEDKPSTETSDSGYSKRYTAFGGLTGYDSDSDEETNTSNFFSLDAKQKEDSSIMSNIVNMTPDVTIVTLPESKTVETKLTPTVESSQRTVTVPADESVLPAVVTHVPQPESADQSEAPGPSMDQDAPLSFRPSTSQHNPLSAASVGARYQYLHSHSSSQEEQHQQYPQYEEQGTEDDISQYMQDEQFLRLQGKRKRGKEEINIIDANMDDFVGTVDVSKNMTEESDYQSHRKKDNNPTSQQRRKKQITYLAFQAKEREFELKNSWANNRVTKRQTQAKYGF